MKLMLYLEAYNGEKGFIVHYEDIDNLPIAHIPRIGEKVLIGARHSIYKVVDVISDIEVDEIKIVLRELTDLEYDYYINGLEGQIFNLINSAVESYKRGNKKVGFHTLKKANNLIIKLRELRGNNNG